jgi:uncharacterized membrane protein YgcG
LLIAPLLLAAVPAPPFDGHPLVDVGGRISVKVRAEVEELAATIHEGGYGELNVLVVDTADDALARSVFDAWPIGHLEKLDGALLVVGTRSANVVLGDGFGRIAKAQAPQLVGKWIVPALQDGDVDTATATGTRAMLDLMVRFHRPTHDDDGGGINEQNVEPHPPGDLPPPADTDLGNALTVPLLLVAPLFLLLLGGAAVYFIARRR